MWFGVKHILQQARSAETVHKTNNTKTYKYILFMEVLELYNEVFTTFFYNDSSVSIHHELE